MTRAPFRLAVPALLAAAALLLALAASAGAGDWWDHDHGRDHGHGHGVTVVKPGESIQAAVDAADPGDTIFVKPGTYAENVAITTDGITLVSRGARLVPPADPAPNACSPDAPAQDGICAVGQLDFPPDAPPTVRDPISDVTIKGFEVTGFAGTGILFLGAENPVVKENRTADNGAYGIARFVSSGGAIVGNEATGSAEAGIYVGDSPNANVLVGWNRSFDNALFGFFLRDARTGKLVENESSGNCVGAIVLNTGPNVAGDWRFFGNKMHDNDRFCAGDEEEGTPPLSGIGIAIANASDNVLFGNVIKDNVPSGQVPFAGGVVIVDARSPGAEPPSRNLVKGNVILGNQPDVFWDGSGTGNVIERNLCRTSVPDGLCAVRHDDDHGDHGDRGHRGHHHGDHHGGRKHGRHHGHRHHHKHHKHHHHHHHHGHGR